MHGRSAACAVDVELLRELEALLHADQEALTIVRKSHHDEHVRVREILSKIARLDH